jgi:hypothetical protein
MAVLPGGETGLLCEAGRRGAHEGVYFVGFTLESVADGTK